MSYLRSKITATVGAIGLLLTPSFAYAWGAEGHRIIALIAADQLTPTAKGQVQQLLGTDDAVAGKRHTNLHAVWDVDTVRALGRSPQQVAAALKSQITARDKSVWSQGSVVDWANETFRIAGRTVYGNISGPGEVNVPLILPQRYPLEQTMIVHEQLEKAGVRLATVLNATLRQ